MKYIHTLLIAFIFSLALTASAHNGIDHSKGETHVEAHQQVEGPSPVTHEKHAHDDPLFNTLSNVIFGAGFVVSGFIVARDMKKGK